MHRYWSHGAFKATKPLKIALCIASAIGFERSIYWWALRHRMHHRFTDTENDPYSAKKGLWFSHIGWLFTKPDYTKLEYVDMTDLDNDEGKVLIFIHLFPLFLILFAQL
jgi:stearoyl-CoA desaturase (Delta-9 desaturase)